MKKFKLFTLLHSLSKKELKEFDLFLKLLYSKQLLAIQVFDYLRKKISILKKKEISLSEIHFDLFKTPISKNSEKKKILNSFSDLTKFLMEYLVWKDNQEESYEKLLLEIRVLKKRKLRTEYFNKIERVSKKLLAKKEWDSDLYFQQMQLSSFKYYSQSEEKFSIKHNEVKKIMNDLDSFYIAQKLKMSCEFQSRNYLLNEEYPIFLLDEVKILQQKFKDENPLANLFLDSLKLIETQDEEKFQSLKKQFITTSFVNKNDQFILLVYLLNFTAIKIREGNEAYLNEAFTLYEFGLQSNLFMLYDYFPTKTFHNIINTGFALGENIWTKKFIDNWSDFLNPKEKEYTINLSLARFEFSRNEFGNAIDILNNIKTKNFASTIQVRLLILRCFFEDNYPKDFIKNQIKNFRKALKRNKTLNKPIINSCLNFLVLFNGLLDDWNKEEMNTLLDKNNAIACKGWIKNKIEIKFNEKV